jgi:hypothetical protein
MSHEIFQEYYYDNWNLEGSRQQTAIIGTTQNGVIYLSMPFFFALFTNPRIIPKTRKMGMPKEHTNKTPKEHTKEHNYKTHFKFQKRMY